MKKTSIFYQALALCAFCLTLVVSQINAYGCGSPCGSCHTCYRCVCKCPPPPPPPPPPSPCDVCPMTQGGWHDERETWPQTNPETDYTTFFCTEEDWVNFLAGNNQPMGRAWYILAPQYIAAYLNAANGACPPDFVLQAIQDAEVFLSTYCLQRDTLKTSSPLWSGPNGAEQTKNILDNYNNGQYTICPMN